MTGAVLVYVSTSGMFVVTDILGGAKSSMISNIIQRQFLGARNWPFGAALSVIFVITSCGADPALLTGRCKPAINA